ncbi:MAG: serine hydrolase [Elusimicrobia bacterium]|nr:serine hydrolase [Elusimicrobiota bacterium]
MRLPLFLAVLLVPAAVLGQPFERYNISYLDHANLAQASARKRAVGRVLGSRVTKRLTVVRTEDGYSLIYRRNGDEESARTAARAHSKLLRRRGLGMAQAVPARRIAEVSEKGEVSVRPPEKDKEDERDDTDERKTLATLIEEHVRELRQKGLLAPDERTAWSVYDFTTDEKLVEINADVKLQAASLIKPFVALAFMHRVEKGKLVYDAKSRRMFERMIQRSDNPSTNSAIKRLGGPREVQALLKSNYGAVFQDLELVEYVPRGGRTYRNKASVGDYSRFLLALWKDELPGSAEIKRLMALPKRDRIHSRTTLPDDVEVYSKTGSTSHLCGDMGVILAKGADGKQYPYTIIGIIEKTGTARNYGRWLRARGNVIRQISGMVFENISSLHGVSSSR